MKNKFITKNAEETAAIGFDYAKQVKAGDILCLYGDLGAGKTTFLQGFAKGMGLKKRIISPTFIIVRQYRGYSSSGAHPSREVSSRQARTIHFYHIDLYRTETLDDLHSIGLEEILKEKDAIVAIEWAEKLGDLLPKKRTEIRFVYVDKDDRKIEICHL